MGNNNSQYFCKEDEFKQIVTESLNLYIIQNISLTIVKYLKTSKIIHKKCGSGEIIYMCEKDDHIYCCVCEPEHLFYGTGYYRMICRQCGSRMCKYN
jgi:hypothetical protein